MNERIGLFRKEAVQHRFDRFHSAPIIQQAYLFRIFCWLSAALLLVALTLLGLTNYQETETARGILELSRGTRKLVSPRAAIVKEFAVAEGQTVTKGQVLAWLSTSVFDKSGRLSQESKIENLQTRITGLNQEQKIQDQLRNQVKEENLVAISSFEVSEELLEGEAEIINSQLLVSERNLNAYEKLLQHSDISQFEYDQYFAIYLDQLRQQKEIGQRHQQLIVQKQGLISQVNYSDLEFQKHSLRLRMEVDQVNYQIDELVNREVISIVAEEDGIVAAIASKIGQPVLASQPLMYIHPLVDDLEAVLFVPSSVMGKLFPGQDLLLSFDAFNYQNYGRYPATIKLISRASLDPRELLLPVPNINEPVFKIVASLAQEYVEGPDVYRLQAGMLLTADFVKSEMSLLSYVFRPLLKLRRRAG